MASRAATPTRSRSTAKPKAAPVRARTAPPATGPKAAPARAAAPAAPAGTERIDVRMPAATAAKIRREAKSRGMAMSAWAREVLIDAVAGRTPTSADMGAKRTGAAAGARAGAKGPTRGRGVKK